MVNLIMAFHSHQPVGNFENVFDAAYKESYLPFIEVLEQHPSIRVCLHYSGPLLDWFCKRHPEFIDRLKRLAKTNQVEFMASGYYEPVIPMLPEADSLGQIKMMKDFIREHFLQNARGAWLTERVWDTCVIKSFNQAGLEFTVVDDEHFLKSGKSEQETFGYSVTEDAGTVLKVFAGSKFLRYSMPFKLPHETIDYLGRVSKEGDVTVVFADDGEKFGFWPGTHKWVYQEKWLENFFRVLEENSSWIKTATFSEVLDTQKPTGRVYMLPASYQEMLEWSNGYFMNFFIKYPESNDMHKKMLYISQEISKSLPERSHAGEIRIPKILNEAKKYLYKGQCNCAYWHGVFGGIYLNYLRGAIYENLIKAQNLIDMPQKTRIEKFDFNKDGSDELLATSKDINAYFDLENGGSIFELDYRPKALNVANVVTRRHEAYHDKIRQKINSERGDQPHTIHESKIKEVGLEKYLIYDQFKRNCLIDHILPADTTIDDFAHQKFCELGDFADGSFEQAKSRAGVVALLREGNINVNGKNYPVNLRKDIDIKENAIEINYDLENLTDKNIDVLFLSEFNFSIYDPKLAKLGIVRDKKNFLIEDDWHSLKINLGASKELDLWHYAVETVSDSESGLERNYQGLCAALNSRILLKESKRWNIKIMLRFS